MSIPFAVSSRGYGLLWNNPAIGKVDFAANFTRWTADQAQAIDYWVTAGTPAEILAVDAPAALGRLGLDAHLSSQRSNGLRAMVERIRAIAGTKLNEV